MTNKYNTPWSARQYLSGPAYVGADGQIVWRDTPENSGRVLAAVNACADLTDEALAAGIIPWLIAQVRGQEWKPFFGMGTYCRECGGSPDMEGHHETCVTGVMYALLGTSAAGESQ